MHHLSHPVALVLLACAESGHSRLQQPKKASDQKNKTKPKKPELAIGNGTGALGRALSVSVTPSVCLLSPARWEREQSFPQLVHHSPGVH